MSEVTTPAPNGQIYVCGACGKTANKLINFKDVSCSVNAVLCEKDSLKYENNRVTMARAVKENNEKEST